MKTSCKDGKSRQARAMNITRKYFVNIPSPAGECLVSFKIEQFLMSNFILCTNCVPILQLQLHSSTEIPPTITNISSIVITKVDFLVKEFNCTRILYDGNKRKWKRAKHKLLKH